MTDWQRSRLRMLAHELANALAMIGHYLDAEEAGLPKPKPRAWLAHAGKVLDELRLLSNESEEQASGNHD